MKNAVRATDVPQERQYVILAFETVNIEDGWGGHYNDHVARYYICESEQEWKAEIIRRAGSKSTDYSNFVAMICIPAQVKTEVTVEVTE